MKFIFYWTLVCLSIFFSVMGFLEIDPQVTVPMWTPVGLFFCTVAAGVGAIWDIWERV